MTHVAFHAVCKSFGTVQVLKDISFDLPAGTSIGLLGENGAGKSTLMKILAGFEPLSAGEVRVDGTSMRFAGPRDAEAAGIAMIHQEFALAEDLTVAQNIFLGHEIKRGWLLDDARMREQAVQRLAEVGLFCSPDARVSDLSIAEKQRVEIAKALQRRAQVLIMDEPTATLTPTEASALFVLMARLKAQGVTLIFISHKLDEVERATDQVVVMRDGRLVTRAPTASLTRQQMASLMVGRELSDLFPPRRATPAGPVRLGVEGLRVPGWVEGASFDVRGGEILGFAGLVGAGRTELFEGLMGLRPASAARVAVDGRAVRIKGPRQAAALGLAYLSEDRKGKGLHLDFDLAPNLTLPTLHRDARPWVNPAREAEAFAEASERFGIRAGVALAPFGLPARALSGGNQQKLALAKVLRSEPAIVILDEPTRGVDVGAKRDIYFLIQRLADEGRAVVVISSEMMELIGLAHRIAVMRAGRIQTTVDATTCSEAQLIAHATAIH